MRNFTKNRVVVYAVLTSVALFFAQPVIFAKTAGTGKGNLTGFIYDQDKITPVEGAVVMLKNLASGAEFQSDKSDAAGAFKMAGIDQGMYFFGVSSLKGGFSSEEVIGIAENETAKLAVALTPDAEVDPKAEDAPQIQGEKWVGKILSYDESTKTARVYMNQNLLKQDENFHIKGDKKKYNSETDFWQKAKMIQENGLAVKKTVAEHYYTLLLEKAALANDFLYIKKSKGLILFFLSPLGLATILAGTTAIVVIVVNPPTEASPFRR